MTYKNAPIQEAVFDIKVGNVSNIDINYYESLKNSVLSDYPNIERKIEVSGRLRLDNEKRDIIAEHKKPIILGVIFTNEGGNKKVQFRKDGFTYNHLRPYTNWHEFSTEAFKYWEIYKRELQPTSIERIALRYINKIYVPLSSNLDFREYFVNMPKVPPALENVYNNLFLRIQAPCKIGDYSANVIYKLDSSEENYIPFMLDIDVFHLKRYPVEKDLNTEFSEIRENKNNIFEAIITDKTRKLFK